MSTWFPSHSFSLWKPHCYVCEEQLSSHPHSKLCPTGIGSEVWQGMTQHTGSTQAQLQLTASLGCTSCLKTIVLGHLSKHVYLFRSGEHLVHAYEPADRTVNVNVNVWVISLHHWLEWIWNHLEHTFLSLSVHFQRHLPEEEWPTLNVGTPSNELKSQTEKRRRGGSQSGVSIHLSLLPVCGCHLTSCPTYFPSQMEPFSLLRVSCYHGLHPQNCKPKWTLPSLSICVRVFVKAMSKGNHYYLLN